MINILKQLNKHGKKKLTTVKFTIDKLSCEKIFRTISLKYSFLIDRIDKTV